MSRFLRAVAVCHRFLAAAADEEEEEIKVGVHCSTDEHESSMCKIIITRARAGGSAESKSH